MRCKRVLLVSAVLAAVLLAIGASAEDPTVAPVVGAAKPTDAKPATPIVEDFPNDDDDDEDGETYGATDDEVKDIEAGPENGITHAVYYPLYSDLKVPAGERAEVLIALHSAVTNPEYEVVAAGGFISMLSDPSRRYQNFSAALYDRKLAPGQTTTLKYSFTPLEAVDPQDYNLVLVVQARPPGEESLEKVITLIVANTTVTVLEPLATDPKSVFTVLLFGGILGGLGYYYLQKQQNKPAVAAVKAANAQDLGRGRIVDKDYVASDHLRFVQQLEKQSAVRQQRSTSK